MHLKKNIEKQLYKTEDFFCIGENTKKYPFFCLEKSLKTKIQC